MHFALNEKRERVFIDEALREQDYFCPECGEKMVQRHGEIMTHCFAHYPNTQCIDNWHYDESVWHFKYQSLFPKENQEIILEFDGKKHRADVCFEERKVVIEIQGDRLRQTEFIARNDFFKSLGYHVIWLFDQTRIFETESINYGYRRKACTRDWIRPSKTFRGFYPQDEKNVEVWFMRSESDFEKQPRFFRILYSYDSLKTSSCSFCYSFDELMRYFKDGNDTPDYSDIYDIKYPIVRTDGSISLYFCPKEPKEAFVSREKCDDCPFHSYVHGDDEKSYIGCAYRIERLSWEGIRRIESYNNRDDGFVETISAIDDRGEPKEVTLDNPKTFLRTVVDLWKIYKPGKYLICCNARTKKKWSIFNPAWQQYKNGIIKGKIIGYRRNLSKELEVYDADKPLWFVVV